MNKQREEYRKWRGKTTSSSQLDMVRIGKLNDIGFRWSIRPREILSWEDRYRSLLKFKKEHGHVLVPRNHPDFGNWPTYQKSQYKMHCEGKKSKLMKDKIDRLIEMGFFHKREEGGTTTVLSSTARTATEDASYWQERVEMKKM